MKEKYGFREVFFTTSCTTTMGNNGYKLFRKYFTAETFAQSYYKNVME